MWSTILPQSWCNFHIQEFIAFSIQCAILHIRLLLAALHFNENFNREQAKTTSGSERIRIVFRKQKKGEYTPKPVPAPKTYRKCGHLTLYAFINMTSRLC